LSFRYAVGLRNDSCRGRGGKEGGEEEGKKKRKKKGDGGGGGSGKKKKNEEGEEEDGKDEKEEEEEEESEEEEGFAYIDLDGNVVYIRGDELEAEEEAEEGEEEGGREGVEGGGRGQGEENLAMEVAPGKTEAAKDDGQEEKKEHKAKVRETHHAGRWQGLGASGTHRPSLSPSLFPSILFFCPFSQLSASSSSMEAAAAAAAAARKTATAATAASAAPITAKKEIRVVEGFGLAVVETTASSLPSSPSSSGGWERIGPLPRINPALTMRGHLVRREGGREGGRKGKGREGRRGRERGRGGAGEGRCLSALEEMTWDSCGWLMPLPLRPSPPFPPHHLCLFDCIRGL